MEGASGEVRSEPLHSAQARLTGVTVGKTTSDFLNSLIGVPPITVRRRRANPPRTMSGPKWTDAERKFIAANWRYGDVYLSAMLNRPFSSVVKERERLGILRKVPLRTVEVRTVIDNPELRAIDFDDMHRRRVEYVRDVIRHSA